MKATLKILVAVLIATPAWSQVRLPDSKRLAGPLDSAVSSFGDEFFNFPAVFQGKADPGSTYLSGWIRIEFDDPVAGYSWFRLRFDAVGTPDGIVFPGGQTYELLNNRAFDNPDFVSKGRLRLADGAIDRLELHALFQNSVIARVTRNIRIPYGFINDYPPVDLPLDLPFADRPEVYERARFHTNSTGDITGFEFSGMTLAPVTLFPKLGLFPPYAFGAEESFYFANPNGCLPDTPADRCLSDANNPDGVRLGSTAFFHPHLDLVSRELRPVPAVQPTPDCAPQAFADAPDLVAAGGRLFLLGGGDGTRSADLVRTLDPLSGRWSDFGRLPIPVLDSQAAAIGDSILVAGGREPVSGTPVPALQVLDTVSGRWEVLAPLPIPVHSGAAAAVGGKFYLIGGRTSPDPAAPGEISPISYHVQVYDPATDSWTMEDPLELPVLDSAVVSAGDRIHVLGGFDVDGIALGTYRIFDPGPASWEAGPPLETPVAGAVGGYTGGRFYLVGGRTSVGGDTLGITQVLPAGRSHWQPALAPPLGVGEASGTVWGGRLLIAGGRSRTGPDTPPGQLQNLVQLFDPATGWTVSSCRPVLASADVMPAGSGRAGPSLLSPGARFIIKGHHLAGTSASAPRIRHDEGRFTTDYPIRLGGIEVLVDGVPAALVSVSPTRVEFVTPWLGEHLPPSGKVVSLEVRRDGSTGAHPDIRVPLVPAAPALYTYNYGELNDLDYLVGATAQVLNRNGLLVHPGRPASPGEEITLILTGLGAVEADLAIGQRSPADPPAGVRNPVAVEIGGLAATVTWSGALPHEAGVYEIRTIVPMGVTLGNNVPVQVTVNGVRSNPVVVAVR